MSKKKVRKMIAFCICHVLYLFWVGKKQKNQGNLKQLTEKYHGSQILFPPVSHSTTSVREVSYITTWWCICYATATFERSNQTLLILFKSFGKTYLLFRKLCLNWNVNHPVPQLAERVPRVPRMSPYRSGPALHDTSYFLTATVSIQ